MKKASTKHDRETSRTGTNGTKPFQSFGSLYLKYVNGNVSSEEALVRATVDFKKLYRFDPYKFSEVLARDMKHV